MKFEYVVQSSSYRLAQSFTLGEEFVNSDDVCLVLSNNIFYRYGLTDLLVNSSKNIKEENKVTVYGHYVQDSERYSASKLSNNGDAIFLEEKPTEPKSSCVAIGLYLYINDVVKKAKYVQLSDRCELEIITLNQDYSEKNRLKNVELMHRGYFSLDTGAQESFENKKQLFVPRGFAHGFVVLEDDIIFTYKVDDYYSPQNDKGILFDDKSINIDWKISYDKLFLSQQDTIQPKINEVKDLFKNGMNYYE